MIDHDDIDGLAAEYVLGVLSPAERESVRLQSQSNAALREAVVAWERRLVTLNEGVPGIEPPSDLFDKIADRLWGKGAQTVVPFPLLSTPRSTTRWRAIAIGTGALAACLALIAAWLFTQLPDSPTKLVAVLHRSVDGATADESVSSKNPPGFLVSIDLKDRTLLASPVAVRSTQRRSYQLWLIQDGGGPPRSLGVISQSEPTVVPWGGRYPPADFVDATVAVSIEPEGGSPAETPTGPTIFAGKLVQSTP